MTSFEALSELGQVTPTTRKLLPRIVIDAQLSALLGETKARGLLAGPTWETEFNSDELQKIASSTAMRGTGTLGTPLLNTQSRRRRGDFVVFRAGQEPRDVVERMEPNRIGRPNADRHALLAKKYVARESFSDEDNARLAIVTERIRQLMPAVTIRDYEVIRDALEIAREIADSNAAIRQMLDDPGDEHCEQ